MWKSNYNNQEWSLIDCSEDSRTTEHRKKNCRIEFDWNVVRKCYWLWIKDISWDLSAQLLEYPDLWLSTGIQIFQYGRHFATPLANFLSFLLTSLRDVCSRGFSPLPVLVLISVPYCTFSLSFSGRQLRRLVGSPPLTKFWFGCSCFKLLNYISAQVV
jgi:hypothetical protein